MSFGTITISAAPFIPLSASYRYDTKIDLNALLYQYDEGYSFFHHPLFYGTKDVKFANESFFSITSASVLNSLIDDTSYIDPAELVLFTALRAGNGKYITNRNNTLYATATSIGSNEFFRIVRNVDGTCSISQNDLYATVVTDSNNFSIAMEAKLTPDTNNLQKYTFYTGGSPDIFTIKTQFIIPEWSPYYTKSVERFLSYYDGDYTNIVKAIGLVSDDDYSPENNYQFSSTVDLQLFAIGFNGKIIWIKYYNELLYKFFNRTVDIEDIISDIQQNFLVEYPYKTEVNLTNYQTLLKTGEMKVNLINLKNIMTPEYNYDVKKE